jgi:4-carboxymuconolactone decarboxylase
MLCFKKGLGAGSMLLVLLIGYNVASAQQKTMIVRISEIEIESRFLAEYKAILKAESAASVRLEPGVVSIFPMYQKENPTQVRILEIYASRQAYESHLKTSHFQQYKSTTLKMVKALKLIDMEMVDPETMPEIFRKISNNMNAQTTTDKNRALDARQQGIVTIAALTATGDLQNLQSALNGGLDSGLTINEIKEVLVQMYAYCGFPRSLNGISTFMAVLEERMNRGITDVEGKRSTPITGGDKYERGRKTLEKLSLQPQSKPAPGFGEFAPTIDRFLKEHLFADIFDSNVLDHQQRELATISALAAMAGVQPQLESHISMGMNTGLTEDQLNQAFDLIEKSISKEQSETARSSLAKVAGTRRKNQ